MDKAIKYIRGHEALQALCALFGIDEPIVGLTVEANLNGAVKLTIQRYAGSTVELENLRKEFLDGFDRRAKAKTALFDAALKSDNLAGAFSALKDIGRDLGPDAPVIRGE